MALGLQQNIENLYKKKTMKYIRSAQAINLEEREEKKTVYIFVLFFLRIIEHNKRTQETTFISSTIPSTYTSNKVRMGWWMNEMPEKCQ